MIDYINNILSVKGIPFEDGTAWFCDGDFGPTPRVFFDGALYIWNTKCHNALASKVETLLQWAQDNQIDLGVIT